MGFKSYSRKSAYYVKLPEENVFAYFRRLVKNIVEMYPHARVHGIRYYFDTEFRRNISYHRKRKTRSKREGSFGRSAVKAKLKSQLIRRDGLICNCCKQAFPKNTLTIDHILPLFMGGNNVKLINLQLLCIPCHTQKSIADQQIAK